MNEEISIGDLALKIADIMGSTIRIRQEEQRLRPGKSEVDQLLASNKKILDYTNWRPGYTLEAGLKETIKWMHSHMNMYKPNHYNV